MQNWKRNLGLLAMVGGVMLLLGAVVGGAGVVHYLETGALVSVPMPPGLPDAGALALPARWPAVGGMTLSGVFREVVHTVGLPVAVVTGLAGLLMAGAGVAAQRRPVAG